VPKPWNADSETKRYWEMLEEVSYAEEMGMENVWFVEHHFRSEWSHSSAPDITLAAISQRTEKMRLGIAVTLAPLHHPLNVASRKRSLQSFVYSRRQPRSLTGQLDALIS
jgi:alkanesulfonate monooxygenase SsuD/methylene tetrahydromethanopterin reductase-like flavin-dependent oxidoreductase (luciferase family)